ncbi:MAG: aminotransferase class V-fold PLP-dependent enzyme [Pseudomonadota bacterium]
MTEALAEAGRAGRNPSSQHAFGRAARARLEAARRDVAALAGAEPGGLIFTSGATEAAALLCAQGWGRIVHSEIEHDAVRAAAAASGAEVAAARAGADGVVDLAALEAALAAPGPPSGAPTLVIVMAANNETGALQPVAEAARLARAAGAAFAVDAAQALGKTAFDFAESGADFALFSGHKIGGPAGVGALAAAPGRDVAPMLRGGGQEMRRRAGTENWLGAVGFGAAAAAADPARWAPLAARRNRLETRLKSKVGDLVFPANEVHRLPNTLCVATPHWRAETQLMRLDLAGFAVSAGAACSSGKMAESHVLRAMGHGPEIAGSAIRVSFGPETAQEELDAFATAFEQAYATRMRAGGQRG